MKKFSLDIVHTASGRYLIQSYKKDCNSDGFSNTIGLTDKEARLVLKKMKELGLNKLN